MVNKDNKGIRIEGARAKGVAHAKAHKSRDANPYERPNMREAWFAGFDSVASTDESDESDDVE